jgi:hypothetical protein
LISVLPTKARKAFALPKDTFEAALAERRRQILANTRVVPLLGIARQLEADAQRDAIQAAALAKSGLMYRWTFCCETNSGPSTQIFDRRILPKWKPILWYVKGNCDDLEWTGDVIESDGDNDKRFHRWGQSEAQMEEIVRRVSLPGQTILDPFCGGGTTGVAALRLGRQFVGIDIDEKCIAQTAYRLRTSLPRVTTLDVWQISMRPILMTTKQMVLGPLR